MRRKDEAEWTEVVGNSLREAEEEALPSGGWRRLEREADIRFSLSAQARKRRWIGYAAAAASVLICVSIGVQVLRMNHNVMNNGVVSVSGAAAGGSEEGTGTLSVPGPSSHIGRSSRDRAASAGLRAAAGHPPGSGNDAEEILSAGEYLSRTAGAGFPDAKTAPCGMPGTTAADAFGIRKRSDGLYAGRAGRELLAELQSVEWAGMPSPAPFGAYSGGAPDRETSGKSGVSRYRTDDYDGLFADAAPAVRKRRGAAGVFAAGIIAGAGSGRSPEGPSYSAVLVEKKQVVHISDAYESYSFEHKQPLSFGLTFRKEFGYGLSLETGLNYTLLRSDVGVTGKVREIRQQLHLVGVPLRVDWQFLRAGRFSMYVGAGGMAEKCVSARFGAEKMTERRVLWSLSGVVGAQYLLGRSVGLYFEPSVTRYLTHTSLRTAYTDSAAALDLRIGLRFKY